MNNKSQDRLYQKEDKLKECVYSTFDQSLFDADQKVSNYEQVLSDGSFEHKKEHEMYGKLSDAKNDRREKKKIVDILYASPYFSHVEAFYKDDNENTGNYFLSECVNLEESQKILSENKVIGRLIPFIKDSKRPLSTALLKCYYGQGRPVTFIANNVEQTLIPILICDTEIHNRVLSKVDLIYAKDEETGSNYDELLNDILKKNRNSPQLGSIIRSLQLQQFEIVAKDKDQSFILQGCAGSGKSQCMIHRLFYLRTELSDTGWDKVLLITPTNLFREYSSRRVVSLYAS